MTDRNGVPAWDFRTGPGCGMPLCGSGNAVDDGKPRGRWMN